ncbi:hypothetical protein [Roseovarius nubinhibens]|uniref:Uncharacterized protein n=1 Tax=Roseovarius nubinhibens (strain ATCC BAA-591 / DSM 15170 / ISM) TaxID=89187 RepID=A3SMR1_ROSNI|nr:hypothetical protein [Roseovarius nubinhibens]EAP75751.1 hypothetical protein ISM_12835 [Roseovarius nubinhibens ISM]
MSDQRIIFMNDDGRLSVLIPANCGLSLEEIAEKDVPPRQVFVKTGEGVVTQEDIDGGLVEEGVTVGSTYDKGHFEARPRPYRIVEASEIPVDRSARNLWFVDEADLIEGASK